jgi:HAD superfamily hydrolase (TIGR01509 family)
VPAVEAVLFDWGGTITPFHDVDQLACWVAAARVIAPDRVDEVAGALFEAERAAWPVDAGEFTSTTTAALFGAAVATTGLDIDPATLERATEAYRREWLPHMPARPEAAGVLAELRSRGLRTGLLSNTHWPRAWHEEGLAADGLLDLLDARVYTSDLPYMKPHPSAFRALLEAVGTTGDRAVFVGDRLHDDIHGARALGMRTVWIPNGVVPHYDVEPDATIHDLGELLGLDLLGQPG